CASSLGTGGNSGNTLYF
nr:T-cell receptor V beta CDR3 region {clone V5Inm17} [mice, NOD, islets, Peptide Partial, 17 aa] [Mus sp.]